MASSTESLCYSPDGGIVSGYSPCNSTTGGAASACCDIQSSVCTTTGYCFGSAGYMYRGGCTDRTWRSSACATRCLQVRPDSFANLYHCDTPGLYDPTSTYCCGTDSPCCNDNFTINPGVPFAAFISQNISDSPTSLSHSSTSISCSSTSLPGPTMGIAVGIPLTALLLVVGGIWALRERRWRHRFQQGQRQELRKQHEYQPPRFDPSREGVSEVWAIRRTAELESRSHL